MKAFGGRETLDFFVRERRIGWRCLPKEAVDAGEAVVSDVTGLPYEKVSMQQSLTPFNPD